LRKSLHKKRAANFAALDRFYFRKKVISV